MVASDDSASATKWETAPVKVTGTPLPAYDTEKSPDPAIGETIPTLTGKSVFDGTRSPSAPTPAPASPR